MVCMSQVVIILNFGVKPKKRSMIEGQREIQISHNKVVNKRVVKFINSIYNYGERASIRMSRTQTRLYFYCDQTPSYGYFNFWKPSREEYNCQGRRGESSSKVYGVNSQRM